MKFFPVPVSRVLALSLFASLYTKWIFLVLALHWFIMIVWIGVTKSAACNSKCEETFFNIILAYIYTFTFMNIKNEPTRYKYLLYYSFCFCENTVLITLWFSYIMDSGFWFTYPAFTGQFCSFLTGMLFMMVYYVYLHPTESIRTNFPIRWHWLWKNFAPSQPSNGIGRRGKSVQIHVHPTEIVT